MTGLARAIVAQAEARPALLLGTAEDPLPLARAVAFASGRARRLLADGARPGEPVALVAPTSTDYLVTWLACLLAGVPVALVNPTYTPDLQSAMLAPLAPTVTLTDTGARDVESTPDGLPGLGSGPLDVVSFMHTSGTTGLPKFCAQSNAYFLRLAAAMREGLRLGPEDTVLAPLPMFHVNPLGYGVVTALLTGAGALTVGRFSASGFWPTVKEHGVTVLILHAPPVEILKRATTAADAAGHSVRTMFYADQRFLRTFGIGEAVSAYGSTEAGGVSHLARWSAADDLPPDVGRRGGPARADVDWTVREDGVVLVREREPGALFSGYVTAAGLDPARDAEGWFDTGDLGARDGEGLVFLERRSESIRVKGEFVPIPFVEEHLSVVDGVRDCAIWKRPGQLSDDEVVAYVVADGLAPAALHARIVELPGFMRPTAVARVDALPRDAAAGKVQRRRLDETAVLEWILT
ncbi:AMP-binding protein [Pseudonocardia kujensis]|uniref:class I adenylate-forming enzyme family protein n=1 Tax=Pseudonocardia kujensis TaxID=1128675 RepID=UPI001E4AAFB1|nr:AMP-binding protein [Pseudonocardia kujensis]MCE0767806.1 AMP-binding protein [Pseudonocardia kujensis]